jgi:hypothetical protein
MAEEVNENIEIDNVVVSNDDMGDLISVLFQAGFSDEESDIILEVVVNLKSSPEGSFMLDDEIMKISDKFELLNVELGEEDLVVIRTELSRRFK